MILDTDKLASDAAYREDMRHRCCTDHFFLAEVMGLDGFVRSIHGPAVELYFPKNKNLPIQQQHPIKNRMHLDPRGTFKTTLGRVDSLQWILAFPEEITILNESATQPLAKAISRVIADYFWKPKTKSATKLQMIFPELVTEAKPFTSTDEWNTEVRRHGDLDSTLAYTSPMTVQAGWHPYVINPDDMVETKNSGIHASDETRRQVIDTYYTNKNTLRHGGYINMRGTRYHPFDLYGETLEKMDPSLWKILIRGSLIVKNGTRLLPGEFPKESDVEMIFGMLPDMDYRALRAKFFENYESFMAQQMNDPMGGGVPKFDEKLYASCVTDIERIPMAHMGETFICWRPMYSGKSDTAKYAEGVAARVYGEKIYILNAWQGIYTLSGFAERIVQAAKEYQANATMIIGVPGSDYLGAHVKNEAARRNHSLRLQWLEFEEDDHRRFSAMENLEPLMKVGRIQFSNAMAKAAQCRSQFVHFGLTKETGILECISKFATLIPLSALRANMEQEEIEYQRRRRDDALINSFLHQEGMQEVDEMAQIEAQSHLAAMESATTWGLPPLPGGLDG